MKQQKNVFEKKLSLNKFTLRHAIKSSNIIDKQEKKILQAVGFE